MFTTQGTQGEPKVLLGNQLRHNVRCNAITNTVAMIVLKLCCRIIHFKSHLEAVCSCSISGSGLACDSSILDSVLSGLCSKSGLFIHLFIRIVV